VRQQWHSASKGEPCNQTYICTWDARLFRCDGVTRQVGCISLSQATAILSGVRNYFPNEMESLLKRLEYSATPLWELQVSYNLEWLCLPSYQKEKPKRPANLQAEEFCSSYLGTFERNHFYVVFIVIRD